MLSGIALSKRGKKGGGGKGDEESLLVLLLFPVASLIQISVHHGGRNWPFGLVGALLVPPPHHHHPIAQRKALRKFLLFYLPLFKICRLDFPRRVGCRINLHQIKVPKIEEKEGGKISNWFIFSPQKVHLFWRQKKLRFKSFVS